MRQTLRLIIASAAVVFASFPLSTLAELATTQIMLTDKNIEAFILVQKDMSEIIGNMQVASSLNPADYKAKLMGSTKKRGFTNVAEYETVAANISMVVAGVDPQTKEFTDPHSAIKKEIEDVAADKTITAKQKKELLTDLNAALKTVEPIQFSSNIALVKKYYDLIDVTMIDAYEARTMWIRVRRAQSANDVTSAIAVRKRISQFGDLCAIPRTLVFP